MSWQAARARLVELGRDDLLPALDHRWGADPALAATELSWSTDDASLIRAAEYFAA